MRICLLTPTFLPRVGGAEFVTDALARRFQAKGHEPVVLAPGEPTALDVPYPVVRYRKPRWVQWFPERSARALRKLGERRPFDVLAINYGHPTGYGAVRLGRKLGVPSVLICHGGDLYHGSKNRKRPHIWRRIRWAYRHADALVAISGYTEQLMREVNPEPALLERIPNGVDAEAINAPADPPADLPDPRPFCLGLGNLTRWKGFDDAIEAFARAADELGELRLVLAGGGRLEGALRERADRLGVTDRVVFAGQRTGNDKRWLLQQCAFGVMPSLEEGHPLVALEMIAAGKPAVCTDLSAFDGIFDHDNALRVPPRDPDALAAALVQMHRADRRGMGAHSARLAEHFDWDAVAERYLDLFHRLTRHEA